MISPELAEKVFHQTKNGEIKFGDISFGSAKLVWWQCPVCHYEWQQPVRNYVKGNGCKVCSGRKPLSGHSDLSTLYPELAKEFNVSKNLPIQISDLSFGSNVKVWWIDQFGHEWESDFAHRVKGKRGCPVCVGKKIVAGVNDLATIRPDLAAQWHPTKNGELKPFQVTVHSGKRIWWQDEHGHEWDSNLYTRTSDKQTGCPICAGKKPFKKLTDLETLYPEVAAKWDTDKNNDRLPTDVTAGSALKVNWHDEDCGHSWTRSVGKQVGNNTCPICTGRKVEPGLNDLATTHPDLAAEWHPIKNGELKPSMVSYGSERNQWWLDKHGHEWSSTVNNRVKGNSCPVCWGKKFSSKAEIEISDFLKALGLNVIQTERSILKNKELDIYLPDLNIAIEYNGIYWHTEGAGKGKTYHFDKYAEAKSKGIQLIQIWEDDWRDNKVLIKKMLAVKTHVPEYGHLGEKIFARKTQARTVEHHVAKKFLEDNHIQGYVRSSYYLGLFDKAGELRALMTLKKEVNNSFSITRYATSSAVVGGFSKLLNYATVTYDPSSYFTFADNMVSDGGLYEKMGFHVEKDIPPDYMYVVNATRVHKFNYRLKRFKNDPELKYLKGNSESQLAQLNGLTRIWDAGKVKYRLETN